MQSGVTNALHGAPQYRATRLPHPASELSRDCSRISPLLKKSLDTVWAAAKIHAFQFSYR